MPVLCASDQPGRSPDLSRNGPVLLDRISVSSDAVERALDLPGAALADSREVLATCGNMSSATLMFVLARMMAGRRVGNGVAVAFGPGLAAEGFGFRSAA